MKIRKIKEKIKRATFGIFTTTIDLFLFTLMMLIEAGTHPSDVHSIFRLQRRFDKLFLEEKDRIIRNAIYKARNKGWIKKDLKLTEEGKRRLKNFLPEALTPKPWDGKWYLVIFDIPEKTRRKRDVLRENLKLLGFCQLKESCWISPVNHFEKVEKIIKSHNLEPCVILAIANKVGKETSKILANKVWQLEKINNEYVKLISGWRKTEKRERGWLKLKYFEILRRDPQLPRELLPKNWQGKKAHDLFKNLPIL